MTPHQTFLWGLGGSLSIEIVLMYEYYQSDPIKLPDRYRRLGFWIVRLLLAVVAGALAVVEGANTPVVAINVGASAPLLLRALSTGLEAKPKIGTRGRRA